MYKLKEMSQTTGLKRNTMDKYYTKDSVVKMCMDRIEEHLPMNDNELIDDLMIEPSAGDGAFIEGIKELTNNYAFYDLFPQNDEIQEQDYLALDSNAMWKIKYDNKIKIHVIGNPPFGRQSSLSLKFISKSCEFADSISFILPKSFKKESIQNKIYSHLHLLHQEDLPKNSFLVNGKDYDVPCVFQIWIRRGYSREMPKKEIHTGFRFVKKDENPDFAFRRTGFYAGRLDTNYMDKSISSHYFIKLDNSSEEMINTLKQVTFETNNTVAQKSISKPELIRKYNFALSLP